MVRYNLEILQQMPQDFKNVSDHLTTLRSKGLKHILYDILLISSWFVWCFEGTYPYPEENIFMYTVYLFNWWEWYQHSKVIHQGLSHFLGVVFDKNGFRTGDNSFYPSNTSSYSTGPGWRDIELFLFNGKILLWHQSCGPIL